MSLLDPNGRPLHPTGPTAIVGGTPIMPYIVKDCTLLFVISPYKSTEFAALGTNCEDIQFLCTVNVAYVFQAFPLQQSPGPGFFVWTFDFKASEKPSITNATRPILGFLSKGIRPANYADFELNQFPPPPQQVTPSIVD